MGHGSAIAGPGIQEIKQEGKDAPPPAPASIQPCPARGYPGAMKKRRSAPLEQALLAGIAEGRTLDELCRRHALHRSTVYLWLRDEDFAGRMAWARAIGFDAIADQMIEIADDSRNDWVAREDAAGGPAVMVRNPDNVTRSRLRIDVRLRMLARWDPKRWGDPPGGYAGMGGLAGMIGTTGGLADGTARPADPVVIATRLASLLTLIATRDGAEAEPGAEHGAEHGIDGGYPGMIDDDPA